MKTIWDSIVEALQQFLGPDARRLRPAVVTDDERRRRHPRP
ncbi:MAG: hypothetical protein AAFN30_11970 [Actinomycetota bacterium]